MNPLAPHRRTMTFPQASPERSSSRCSSNLKSVSYDLVFWQQDDTDHRPPLTIYEAFAEGPVSGIPELPIETFLERLIEAFPKAVREPNGEREWIAWTSRDGRSSFQVEWSPQHVSITCRPLDESQANAMIDIANAFGCPLYDPQTDERFSV